MALTKETKIAKIEMIGDFKLVHVAYDNVFKEDGEVVSTSRTRDIVDIGYLDDSNNLVLNDNREFHTVTPISHSTPTLRFTLQIFGEEK